MEDGFLSGQILIAMPGISDQRFERGVILICAHDAKHAMGLALNRPVQGLTVPRLLEKLDVKGQIKAPPDLVLLGGPVQPERGFVLHTDDYRAPDSIEVPEGLAVTGTRDVLHALAAGGGAPRLAKLALGYAGWGAGQLENELKQNVWLSCPADEELVFGPDHEQKWTQALARLGVDPEHLGTATGRA
jgi:putative transcriptional regulator